MKNGGVRVKKALISIAISTLMMSVLSSCGPKNEITPPTPSSSPVPSIQVTLDGSEGDPVYPVTPTPNAEESASSMSPVMTTTPQQSTYLDELEFSSDYLASLNYAGHPYITINDNVPYFTEEERTTTKAFETYPELDQFNRCGPCVANICRELMPTEERGEIGMVKPSGWQTVRYDNVEGKYLYNRCHLIGFQLAGENANVNNLITGTRYLNVQGMLPFENTVADYVHQTGNHVMYRVTPIFKDHELVARGVLMEAYSVEDAGLGVQFNVFCFNVQPGVRLDYATGDNWADNTVKAAEDTGATTNSEENNGNTNVTTYVLNTRSKKFHLPTCSSVPTIADHNRQEVASTREALLNDGYTPCGKCNP